MCSHIAAALTLLVLFLSFYFLASFMGLEAEVGVRACCYSRSLHSDVACGCCQQVKGLSLADRFTFASSPTNARSRPAIAALLRFAGAYAAGLPAPLDLDFPRRVPATPDELRDLEEAYKARHLRV